MFTAATCCTDSPFGGGQVCVDTGSFGDTPGGGGGPPGGGGPTPTPPPAQPAALFDGYTTRVGYDLPVAGNFFSYVVVEGVRTSPYHVLEVVGSRNEGRELCNGIDDVTPQITIKWDVYGQFAPAPPNPTSPFTTYGVGYYDQSPLHCIGGHVLFAQSWGYWRSDAPPVFDLIKRPNTVDGHVHCYALWPAVGTNTPNCFDQPGTTF